MINLTATRTFLCEGERIRLRWWTTQDDQRQRSWPQYSEPCSHLWNIPRSGVSSGRLFGGYGTTWIRRAWAIEDRQGTLIGRISLREIDQRSGRARLGISVAAPYVSQGLGSEALRVFLNHFFVELNFTVMVLDVAAFNRRAVRCYARLGFTVVQSDWRRTAAGRCASLLTDPAHAAVQQYFRRDRYGIWVEFYEMELTRVGWEAAMLQREHQITRAGTCTAPALA